MPSVAARRNVSIREHVAPPILSPSRRDALLQLSAQFAAGRVDWSALLDAAVDDPLAGTIASYQAGRARRNYSANEATTIALARARAWGDILRAVDLLSDSAIADARASDARQRRGALRGPLDGVSVLAKAIYDVQGLPTAASNAA